MLQGSTVTVCVPRATGGPTARTAVPVRTGARALRKTARVLVLQDTGAPTADEVTLHSLGTNRSCQIHEHGLKSHWAWAEFSFEELSP